MKKKLLTLFSLLLSFYLLHAQTSAPTAIFVVADAKADKNPKEVAKELKKDIKKVLQKLRNSEVSELSKARFATEFGNVADVQWERTDYFDVATFTRDGQKMKVYFDINGEFVGTLTEKTFDDIPAKAKDYIKEKYAEYTIGDVVLYTDNSKSESDMLLFGIEMESATSYFVELRKDNKSIILKVSADGDVSFFKELKS